MIYALHPHRDSPGSAVSAISVSVERSGSVLALTYTVEGDLAAVRWSDSATPARTDELWMHTCFEAFIQPVGQPSYTELNLSPSGRWASYAFDRHRSGVRDADAAPTSRWQLPVLTASVDLPDMADADWRVGLTTVVETVTGEKSYWALAHPDGPPDFHDAACFTARLPAPDRP